MYAAVVNPPKPTISPRAARTQRSLEGELARCVPRFTVRTFLARVMSVKPVGARSFPGKRAPFDPISGKGKSKPVAGGATPEMRRKATGRVEEKVEKLTGNSDGQ
jgi:hypothetical protein